MKKIILFISCIAFSIFISSHIKGAPIESEDLVGDSIFIWSSQELSNLTKTWVNNYKNTHPDVQIKFQQPSNSSKYSELESSSHIVVAYPNEISGFDNQYAHKIIVARDILVPIMNENNPYKEEIIKQGISSKSFSHVYSLSGQKEWGMLLNKDIKTPLLIYKLKDSSNNLCLEMFLNTDLQNQGGLDLDVEDFIKEIQNNPNAIGFCKLSQFIDPDSKDFITGIIPIPIDINNNQKLDYIEKMYKSPSDLARGAWIGKYPNTLYRNIFAVLSTSTAKTEEIDFLEWMINDGQSSLSALGFSKLVASEKVNKMKGIYYEPVATATIESNPFLTKDILFLLFAILVVGFIAFAFNSLINKRPVIEESPKPKPLNYFSENSVLAPAGLFFDKHHTWAFMEKNGQVKLGLDDFLQHTIGTITKVKMKKAGTRIEKGEPLISITQKGKKLDIHSPITGIIHENNEKLIKEPYLINNDPYNEGWITSVQAEDWLKETKSFVMGEKYKTELKKEFSRLKDFLTLIFKQEGKAGSLAILQDGGELNDAPLEQLGPEAWEEFQVQFMNRMSS